MKAAYAFRSQFMYWKLNCTVQVLRSKDDFESFELGCSNIWDLYGNIWDVGLVCALSTLNMSKQKEMILQKGVTMSLSGFSSTKMRGSK